MIIKRKLAAGDFSNTHTQLLIKVLLQWQYTYSVTNQKLNYSTNIFVFTNIGLDRTELEREQNKHQSLSISSCRMGYYTLAAPHDVILFMDVIRGRGGKRLLFKKD